MYNSHKSLGFRESQELIILRSHFDFARRFEWAVHAMVQSEYLYSPIQVFRKWFQATHQNEVDQRNELLARTFPSIKEFRLVLAISFGVCETKSSMAMPAYPADSTPHDTGGGSAPLQTVPQGWGRSWFWQTKDAHLRS